jgi:hypothetical protein
VLVCWLELCTFIHGAQRLSEVPDVCMWSGARGVMVVARELGAVVVIVNGKAGGDGDSMRIWGVTYLL